MTMTFKKSVAALASVAALTFAGSANAYLTNWYLDANGATGGSGDAVQVANYLNLNGQAFVQITSSPLPTPMAPVYTFNEAGFFNTFSADGATSLGANPLHSEFTASGFGDINTAKVIFNAGGLLNIYNVANSLIGTFSLTSGDGQLQTGTVLPNGTFSLIFQAQSLAAGYFYDSAMNDLSTNVGAGLTFGFATTNAIDLLDNEVNATNKATLAGIYNKGFGTSLTTVSDNNADMLLIGNDGQFRLAIPEPTSMALVGLGLTGLAALRRRKA